MKIELSLFNGFMDSCEKSSRRSGTIAYVMLSALEARVQALANPTDVKGLVDADAFLREGSPPTFMVYTLGIATAYALGAVAGGMDHIARSILVPPGP